ncbi:hypothetical protein [Solibacillus sp. FSL H8-0538]
MSSTSQYNKNLQSTDSLTRETYTELETRIQHYEQNEDDQENHAK